MLGGFQKLLMKNTNVTAPRATLNKGVLTLNKQAIEKICKKGNIEVGINTKDKKICICASDMTGASIPIKQQNYKSFFSKDFIRLVSKMIDGFDHEKKYVVPIEAGEGHLILSFGEAEETK